MGTSRKKIKTKGFTLVVFLILLVLVTLIGIWGLSSSRWGLYRSGMYRGAMKVQYAAEEGLQKALLRIQNICNQSDAIGNKSMDYLFETVCDPTTGCAVDCCPDVSHIDLACPTNFDSSTGLDAIYLGDSNVICNLMGTTLADTQIILVRKPNYTDDQGKLNGVFLVNSISTDVVGRKKIVQGVVIVPYEYDPLADPNYSLSPFRNAYLSTTKANSGG